MLGLCEHRRTMTDRRRNKRRWAKIIVAYCEGGVCQLNHKFTVLAFFIDVLPVYTGAGMLFLPLGPIDTESQFLIIGKSGQMRIARRKRYVE
jgi:hypothetical protein